MIMCSEVQSIPNFREKFHNKISKFCIHGNFLNLLCSYLNCRTLAVKVSHYISNYFQLSSGVPKGSHLGPLILIMFIKNFPPIFDNAIIILLFADDASKLSTITSRNSLILYCMLRGIFKVFFTLLRG